MSTSPVVVLTNTKPVVELNVPAPTLSVTVGVGSLASVTKCT